MSNYSYHPDHVIKDEQQLRQYYGEPSKRSLIKVLDHISDHYRAFIQASPFVLVASVGPEGVDVSPRGDQPGFVHIVDPKTLMLPDRKGNNRADTLMNIVRDPRVSLLFLIPGVGETLRVVGSAKVVVDDNLCTQFAIKDKPPRSVMVLDVEEVYFQCQKALARSQLWSPDSRVERGTLPTAGQILAALDKNFDGEAYDANYPQYLRETIY